MHINLDKIQLNQALGCSESVSLVKHQVCRKRLQIGDLFAFEIVGNGWYTGRVIKIGPSTYPGATEGMFSDICLVYFYKKKYSNFPKDLSTPILPKLLLPPTILNLDLWLNGYAVPIGNFPLCNEELLSRHCFWHYPKKRFHDENGKRINEPCRPCGTSSVTLIDGVRSRLARSLRDGFDQDNHPFN